MEDAENFEDVYIIGKGHSDCFVQLMREWWVKQLFVDVRIFCTNQEKSPIFANRSILAAASPVFAKIFADFSETEEMATVHLVGYEYREVKLVSQYIYTGFLPSFPSDESRDRIFGLLHSLEVHLPSESEISAKDVSNFLNVEVDPPPVKNESKLKTYSRRKKRRKSRSVVMSLLDNDFSAEDDFYPVENETKTRFSTTRNQSAENPRPVKTYSRNKTKKTGRPLISKATPPTVSEASFNLDLPESTGIQKDVTLQNPADSPPPFLTSNIEKFAISESSAAVTDQLNVSTALLNASTVKSKPVSSSTPKPRKVLKTYVRASALNSLRLSDIKSIYQLDGKVQVKINGAAVEGQDLPGDREDEAYEKETGEALRESQADYRLALQYLAKEQARLKRLRERSEKTQSLVSKLKDFARKFITLRTERRAKLAASNTISPQLLSPPPSFGSRLSKHSRVTCRVCNKDVKVSWLPSHMAIHSGEKPHQCEICGRSFALSYMLRTHKKAQHAEQLGLAPELYLCSTCGKSFRQKDHLKSHMATHSTEKPHTCRYCGKGFRLRQLVVQHERIHTGEKPYKCVQCGAQFKQSGNLHAHLTRHARRDLYGGKRSSWSQNFLCPHCPLTFPRELLLRVHIATHTGEILQLKCTYCSETFSSMEAVSQHKRDTHADLKTRCQLCRRLVGHENMEKHMKLHETNVEQRQRFECPTCGKKFTTRGAMQIHQRGQHSEVKPFQCPHCDKRFAAKGNLTMHIRVHTDERPYKCPTCPKAFRQWKHLQVHRVQHTGERPYVCQFCSKAFKQRTTLDGHLRIHLNTKITCAKCGRVFPSKAQLMRHMATEEASTSNNEHQTS